MAHNDALKFGLAQRVNVEIERKVSSQSPIGVLDATLLPLSKDLERSPRKP